MTTPQETYDTLLVVGWKKEWNFSKLASECLARGVDVMGVNRRAFQSVYNNGTPVRAAVHQTCPLMDDHLWRCKNFKDFLTVRDNLWKGAYTFKGGVGMIDKSDKKKHKRVLDKISADIDMQKSIMEGSHKLGGCNTTKRNGRKK